MSTAATVNPSAPSISLSTNDSAVLQALFDAESSPSGAVVVDSSLPALPSYLGIPPGDHESLQTREKTIISLIHSSSPTTPISKATIDNAIKELTDLIDSHPNYPSAYANRAQALRMSIEISSKAPSSVRDEESEIDLLNPTNTAQVSSLFSDLGRAIALSTPRSPADPVSTLQAKILADSHTHRGYLLLRLARQTKNEGNGSTGPLGGPERLRSLEADQLEEMASQDFFFGGRFGNKVAQQLAVQTNPYAKMCGAIVKEAIRKEMDI